MNKRAPLASKLSKPSAKDHKVSAMLEQETKKMEEKLDLVKKMMELEKDKRSQMQQSKEGSIWRGATTKKKIGGYSDAVINHHKKNQQNLPPTTLVTETRSQRPSSKMSQKSQQSAVSSKQAAANFTGKLSTQGGSAGGIQGNLNKALQQQNDEYGEIRAFLTSIKLEKYFDKFIDNGVEDEETALELQDQHIEQMGIPLGHKLKIIKKIKDIRAEKGMSVPQSREGTRPKDKEIQYKDGISSKPVTNHQYEELPDPHALEAQQRAQQQQQQPGMIPALKKTNNSSVGIEELKDGVYNEAESHESFLEALNAWRGAGKKKEEEPGSAKSSKKVKFQEVEKSWALQNDKSKKGSFFANLDNSSKDFNMGAIPTWQEGGTQPDKKLGGSGKESCWQCYKLYALDVENSAFKEGAKGFCTRACYDKYMKANTQKCALETCQKQFIKTEGVLLHAKWFCCQNCGDSDPNVKKHNEMQAKLALGPEYDDEEDFEIDL